MAEYGAPPALGWSRRGPAVRAVIITLFAIWLLYAVGLNWAGAPAETFLALCGGVDGVLHGQVWRLVTPVLLHNPRDVWHILFALLGFYFLAPELEREWGVARFLRFLLFSALFGYGLQFLMVLALPLERLAPEPWFGSTPVLEAVAIAWAMSFRGQVVRIFFGPPVSGRMLIWITVGLSVLFVIAQRETPSGLISPFGGMLAGWLLGGGTPSPLRRAWLKLQLAKLDAEARREARSRKQRAAKGHLRVIEGGGEREGQKRGPDGRWLN